MDNNRKPKKSQAQKNREYNLSKFRRGLCRRCMEPRLPGKLRCRKHLDLESKRLREYRHRIKMVPVRTESESLSG